MSTDMTGIYQSSLFSTLETVTTHVSPGSKYRVLAECLPWPQLAEVANKYRSIKININNGARLDLRCHLGAYIAQAMNGWTDRATEDMVRHHAGVRILCGIESSDKSIDHTSIETFRNMVGPDGAEELNFIIVQYATGAGFTGSTLCSSDTTVQEAPIAYPTEVGHLKKIMEKLTGIGKKCSTVVKCSLETLAKNAKDIFTEIRLFTKGKKEKAVEKKKILSKKLHQTVKKIFTLVETGVEKLSTKSQDLYQEEMDIYKKMISQIKVWLDTGFHPKEKIISLWNQTARAISRGKDAKDTEFGRRWSITRLLNGYILGRPCEKLGSDSDGHIAEEVLTQFLEVFGVLPEKFIYDRGGDGSHNHDLLSNLGIQDCIFLKGKIKMPVIHKEDFLLIKKERALSEAAIATLKIPRYNFTRPRAKTEISCITKGHKAILGANLSKIAKDLGNVFGMSQVMG
jgi:IS5 family transposase